MPTGNKGGFKDHFSGHAGDYARYRPRYPDHFFDSLAEHSPGQQQAWDVGCGNGQLAAGLSRHFERVYATDASAEQVAAAPAMDGVTFAVEPAEHCSLPDDSADLVTVGQALHWFDHPAFFAEAGRVLRPGGLFVAVSYALCRISPAVDAEIEVLYRDVLGPYWPPERALVESGYAGMAHPFTPVTLPAMDMRLRWSLADLVHYLNTWSAAQRHEKATGKNAIEMVLKRLEAVWGEPNQTREVVWPLNTLSGRKTRHA
ncbi:class I SAM-dependent methyltransferase [Marinihelvus fidelis]|uniref:Class I SAM-dependent methyltransferase n=1 Tax=Marinihelvus fidelis TaxID=2613842 RepID=A0A5N0TJ38_9GAMM|nr:class I SAM-dependent methyltransferase [Marinihelvus fidelis]KAA9133309.1 class I SAM-dependent methyltransferase [Marinihelvus fidelis]